MTTNESGWQDLDADDFDEDDDLDFVDEATDEETDGDDLEQSSGGALRKQLVDALSRIKELEEANDIKTDAIKGKDLDDAFAANGLSREEGIGKAIALGYDGEADADELAAHLLTEYGYEWTGEPHPFAKEIEFAQAQLDQISAASGSVPIETPWNEELARAEAQGDWGTTMAMKGQVLRSQLERQ